MFPLQIAYHGSTSSPALTELIRGRAEQLQSIDDRIVSMRVVVEPTSRHHRQGTQPSVRAELALPGRNLVVIEHARDGDSEGDAYQAVRRTFESLRRRLATTAARRTQERGRQSIRRRP